MAPTGTTRHEAAPAAARERGFGPYLKRLRKQAGLSQRALASRVDIDVTYLSKLENGRQGGSERVLRSLAEQLGVPLAELMAEAGRVPDAYTVGPEMAEAPAGHLPRYRTSFINRADEVRHFDNVWRRPANLITITGPPGCGKTRLASHLARGLAEEGTTARWLEVCPGEDVGRLNARLDRGDYPPLIVLNDAELALEATTDAAIRLLNDHKDLRIVVTSRQRLGVRGEQLLPLAGLAIPERHLRPDPSAPGVLPDLGRLQEQDSVKLFVERAKLASPGFQLDATNAVAVFDLCRWLDGLPLAIELAALRLRQVTVVDLAAELRDLLPWLAGNAKDTPPRHTSMATAIGWSFDQLTPEQRLVAGRLCSFSTPFRIGDATEVAHDDQIPAERVQEVVLELIDRSLLVKQMDHNQRAQYRWPIAIREYGRRELEHGGDARIRDRYTTWLLRFMESLKNDRAWSETEWAKLAALSPDVFAAVHRLPAEEQHAAVSRLEDASVNLLLFGHREGSDLVERLAARSGDSRPDIFRQAGIAARVKGDWAEAEEYLKMAHQAAVSQRDLLGEANILRDLAENAADQENYERATEQATKAGARYEELDDAIGRLEVKNLLGKLLLETGELARAEQVLEEARQGAFEMEARRLAAYSLHNLGLCDLQVRRVASARTRLGQSLEIRRTMGNLRGVARLFESFAVLESMLGNHAVALRLLGAATQIRSSREVHGIPQGLQRRLDRVEADARIALAETPDDVEGLLGEGAAMSIEAAATLALHDTDAVFRDPLEKPAADSLRWRAPAGCEIAGERDGKQRETPLDLALHQLEAGSGSGPDVHRRLHSAELLVLGEPIGQRTEDILCFAVRPLLHRGVLLPAFSGPGPLAEARKLRPEWADKPVLTVRFEQLRSDLIPGDTIVINPFLPSEYRYSPGEQGYQAPPSALTSTVLAPTSPSLASSRS